MKILPMKSPKHPGISRLSSARQKTKLSREAEETVKALTDCLNRDQSVSPELQAKRARLLKLLQKKTTS